MGVNFHVEILRNAVVYHTIKNHETDVVVTHESYDEACAAWAALAPADHDVCTMSAVFPGYPDDLDVQMSNTNAMAVIASIYGLGVSEVSPHLYTCGVMASEDLAERCLLARAFCPDEEISGSTSKMPGGPTVVDLGRPQGYLADKLGAVEDLALANPGRRIVWG